MFSQSFSACEDGFCPNRACCALDCYRKEVVMAALKKDVYLAGFLGFFSRKPRAVVDSRRAREFANRVYNETGGPTPEAKRLYAELLENERRSGR